MAERVTCSARRRRERRLRSWLRHERMTVADELSAALHHSRDGECEPCVGLRAQKTDSTAVEEEEKEVHEAYVVPREQKRPPPGERPAPLSEVARPQSAVTVGYVAARVPLLGAPSMASPSAEAIDESTLSFLVAGNLARVEEEEEELATKEQVLVSEIEQFLRSYDRSRQITDVEN